MEQIEINGFLTIDHAKFEIKKINILIGAQAQGKSVIAKLVYFFKNYFSEIFIESIKKFETKRDIEKKCLIQFEKIFPRYSWANQEFSIFYKNGDYHISIIRTNIDNKYVFKLNYCKELTDFHKRIKNRYKSILDYNNAWIEQENEKMMPVTRKDAFFYEKIFEEINNSAFNSILNDPIFIPEGRSFFTNLQRNIFSFLANDIDINPFIKEFGHYYEQSKRFYEMNKINFIRRHDESNETINKIDKLVSDIVVGEYIYEDEQDWILNKGKRTNLANASSGQQESLPMLLILKIQSPMRKDYTTTFFIEEPEAHLFPTSQKQIISLIATIYNAFEHSFFITTHSPYILTAINNLVAGQDAYDKANGDKDKLKRLEKFLPKDELIRLEDVSAYTLNKGKLESIIDMENRLIGANLLDAVSDEFDLAFGVATEILYGDD
jgi:AAA15 family ATPase/GTPase